MTKKNILIILLVSCFLTIMAIAVFGKEADHGNRIKVTGLQIRNDEDQEITDINDSYWEEKLVTLESSTSFTGYSYFFSVAVLPENATDLSLDYKIILGQDYATLTMLRQELNIYYFKIDFNSQESCKLEFTTNINEKKTDYLYFVWKGVSNSDEI